MATIPSAPEKMTLDRSDGSATIDLYRAVLGPLRTDYYLKAFTRFDAAGKSGPSWNWAAALQSLNWMLFRQLWNVALSYTGAVMAAALLVFGIGRLVFQLSEQTQWALLLLGALLAIALPGAYGNAWLYAACNRKMERALKASATLEEACALLALQAGGVKRLVSLAGLNLALCLIVAALALSWPAPGALPLHTGPIAQTQVTGQVQSGLVQSSLVSQNLSQPASAPAWLASAPQAVASLASPAPAPASVPAVPTMQAPEKESVEPVPAPKPEKALPAEKPAKLTKSERLAKAKAAKMAAKVAAKTAAREAAKEAPKSKPAKTAAVASSASESGKYLINVGLFADANNARNAYAKLQDAGLPALSQEFKSSKGARTRVRVGPFETQVEADRAAERIRALQLDALVFKQ